MQLKDLIVDTKNMIAYKYGERNPSYIIRKMHNHFNPNIKHRKIDSWADQDKVNMQLQFTRSMKYETGQYG